MWFVGPVAVVGVGIRKCHLYRALHSLWMVGHVTNERLQRFTLHIKWAALISQVVVLLHLLTMMSNLSKWLIINVD